WKRGFKETWCERGPKSMTDAEWADVKVRWQRADEERDAQEADRRAKARKVADWLLARSIRATDHLYLRNKGVLTHGNLRVRDGKLLLPLVSIANEVQSVQFIDTDGIKRFLRGGRIEGCFFALDSKAAGPLVIAEGYATAASICEATGFATIAA